MSSEAFSGRSQPTRSWNWPWLMGGVTLLITIFFPPLNLPVNYAVIPDWVGTLITYGLSGGIGWQVLYYVRENILTGYPFSALFWVIAPFCFVPLVLALSSVLVWKRVTKRALRLTIRRGLLAVVLAAGMALLTIVLLALLIFGPWTLIAGQSALLLGMSIIIMVAVSQILWFLPALLIAGAILATLQARSRPALV